MSDVIYVVIVTLPHSYRMFLKPAANKANLSLNLWS